MTMSPTAESLPEKVAPDALAAVVAVWSELKSWLERQSADLYEEARNYPTPIARCDDQLPLLIERRSRAMEHLRQIVDADPGRPEGSIERSLERLAAYLASPESAIDDEQERVLRARLREALDRLRP
jgi:hypothetical protein